MPPIRAFVGHSFSQIDEGLNKKFLDFFDTLKGIVDFMWEHAENASPVEVAAKVKRLIKDKNTFIGICTKKERVLPNSVVGHLAMFKYLYSASKHEFKTSDWIIQEIGLAVGRDMSIILLIEDGVKPPTDLLGNIEYILFSRERPEAAFQKIIQMVTSLSKGSQSDTAFPDTETDERPPQRDEIKAKKSEMESKPHQEDEGDRLKLQFMQSSFDGKDEVIETAKTEIEDFYRSQRIDEFAEIQAFCEWIAIDTNTGGKMQNLEDICARNPDNPECRRYLAFAFSGLGVNDRARDEYMRIFEIEEAKERRKEALAALGRMAVSSIQHDDKYPYAIIEKMRDRVSADTEAQFLDDMNEIVRISGKSILRMIILERLVRIRPEDAGISFDIAYLYSNNSLNDLSFMHYDRRYTSTRGPYEANNLGVVSGQLGLKAKSIDSYKDAVEKKNSLAAANLAHLLFGQGFLQEGLTYLNQAQAFKSVHPNVYDALASVDTRREEEDKKIEEITKRARQASNFASDIGSAVSRSRTKLLHENWLGPVCALTLRKGGLFVLQGQSVQRKDSSPSPDKLIHIRYEGAWEGCALFGKVKKTPLPQSSSPSGGMLTSALGMMLDMPIEEDFIGHLSTDDQTLIISERRGACFGDPYKIIRSDSVALSEGTRQ